MCIIYIYIHIYIYVYHVSRSLIVDARRLARAKCEARGCKSLMRDARCWKQPISMGSLGSLGFLGLPWAPWASLGFHGLPGVPQDKMARFDARPRLPEAFGFGPRLFEAFGSGPTNMMCQESCEIPTCCVKRDARYQHDVSREMRDTNLICQERCEIPT